uniref:hypothetical protein n=1 Tax=Variovorax sp. BK018 TaxID=3450241 RepID=UPI004039A52D
MIFYSLAQAGLGSEKVTNEVLNGLPPILQRYEIAFEKSQGKCYQDEYVQTIGIQLAMLTVLQPKLSNVLPGPERMIYRGASKAVPPPVSDNAQQLLRFYKASQTDAKNSILARARELTGSGQLKPAARANSVQCKAVPRHRRHLLTKKLANESVIRERREARRPMAPLRFSWHS